MSINLESPEVKFAIEAACAAGMVARTIQQTIDVQGLEKDDRSPVTIADFSCQAIVAHALKNQFPNAVLVGEEDSGVLRSPENDATLAAVTEHVQKALPDATAESVCDWIDHGNGEPCERFWTLDPIDGTKGYLRGEQYAVALALIEKGQVQLGVLVCPNLGIDGTLDYPERGLVMVAQRGQGAYRTKLDDPTTLEQCSVSDRAELPDARLLRSVESGHTNTGRLGDLVTHMNIQADPVCLDSQAKYAVLACGGGEALLRLLSNRQPDYKEMIWDQAAGVIVIEEAGGRVTDLSGKPLDFSQGRTLAQNSGVCASNGHLHEGLLAALAAVD